MKNYLSLKNKLIIGPIIAIFFAVVLLGVFTIFYQKSSNEKRLINDTNALLEILGENVKPAVIFQDSSSALSVLSGLSDKKNTVFAGVYLENNTKFAAKQFGQYSSAMISKFLLENSENKIQDDFLFSKIVISDEGKILCKVLTVTSLHSLNKSLQEFINFFILIISIVSILSVVFLYLFQRSISQPILNLTNAAINISNNKTHIPLVLNRNDELGILSSVFDKMVQDIVHAKEFAEHSKKMKEMFLANMSHEIRTPMNSIIGFTNLVLKTDLSQKQAEFLQNIKINASNLLIIINDILDYSKIEAGKISLEKVPFSIKTIAQNVVIAVGEKAKINGNNVNLVVDDKIPDYVNGDPTRLYQILLNLASNAVKFTHNGNITIHTTLVIASANIVQIKFEVIDTGIGIAKDLIDKMFDSFTQATNDTTRKYGGTGLGLSIVKQLIELQGGKVNLESELNKGSNFNFTLQYDTANSITSDTQTFEIDKEKAANYLKNRKFRILLVEDILFNRVVAIETMQTWGLQFEIVEAENGLEAITQFKKFDFDVILMDIQMPEMDGNAAAAIIRKEFEAPKNQIPIIAMSAHAAEKEISLSRENGMNDYITKPFDADIFFMKLLCFLITPDELEEIEKMEVVKNDTNNPSNSNDLIEIDNINEETKIETMESNENVVNLQFIIDFTKGDVGRITKMVNMFLKFTPDEMIKTKQLYNEQKFDELGTLVHSFKAKFTYMGIPQLSVLAKEIELNAKNRVNLKETATLIQRLNAECQKAFKELESYLATLR